MKRHFYPKKRLCMVTFSEAWSAVEVAAFRRTCELKAMGVTGVCYDGRNVGRGYHLCYIMRESNALLSKHWAIEPDAAFQVFNILAHCSFVTVDTALWETGLSWKQRVNKEYQHIRITENIHLPKHNRWLTPKEYALYKLLMLTEK